MSPNRPIYAQAMTQNDNKAVYLVPNAGLSVAAAPKLKLPICGAGLLETGVPN